MSELQEIKRSLARIEDQNRKILALLNKKEPQRVLVFRKQALKETGMSAWHLHEAVKLNPAIRPLPNRYDLGLLKTTF